MLMLRYVGMMTRVELEASENGVEWMVSGRRWW